MAYFVELHSTFDDDPLLINVEAIGYVEPHNDGTSSLHMCGTNISSSGQRVDGCMERVHVKESYQIIKLKLK